MKVQVTGVTILKASHYEPVDSSARERRKGQRMLMPKADIEQSVNNFEMACQAGPCLIPFAPCCRFKRRPRGNHLEYTQTKLAPAVDYHSSDRADEPIYRLARRQKIQHSSAPGVGNSVAGNTAHC